MSDQPAHPPTPPLQPGVYGPKFARVPDLPPLPPTIARWNGRLPLGEVTLLVGTGGVGKGLLGVWFASHITTGRALPDEELIFPVGDVCVVTLEDSLTVWTDRYAEAGGDPDRLVVFRVDNEAFSMGDLNTLSGEYGLLIIDPAISLCSVTGVNPGNPVAVRGMIDNLQKVAQRLHCPVLLVHHPNSRGNVSGGPTWSAAVRSQLELGRQQDKTLGLFHTKFNNVSPQEPAQFRIDVEDAAALTYIGINEDLKPFVPKRPKAGEDDGSGKKAERLAWIIDMLAEHNGDMAHADLRTAWHNATGFQSRTLSTILEWGEKQGKVVRVDKRPTLGYRVMLKAVWEQDQLIDQLVASIDEEYNGLLEGDNDGGA